LGFGVQLEVDFLDGHEVHFIFGLLLDDEHDQVVDGVELLMQQLLLLPLVELHPLVLGFGDGQHLLLVTDAKLEFLLFDEVHAAVEVEHFLLVDFADQEEVEHVLDSGEFDDAAAVLVHVLQMVECEAQLFVLVEGQVGLVLLKHGQVEFVLVGL